MIIDGTMLLAVYMHHSEGAMQPENDRFAPSAITTSFGRPSETMTKHSSSVVLAEASDWPLLEEFISASDGHKKAGMVSQTSALAKATLSISLGNSSRFSVAVSVRCRAVHS